MWKRSLRPALCALVLFGCEPKSPEPTLYADIDRIVSHGSGRYTFYTRLGVSDRFEVVHVDVDPRRVEVYDDRKAMGDMWAEVHEERDGCGTMRRRLEIHVRDLSDIE